MAAKKKSARRSGTKRRKTAPYSSTGDCSLDQVCKFLRELSDWLKWFDADYTKLRRAMCNVERKAWGESGSTAARRFCTGGGVDEPPAPTRPPVWT